MENEKIRNFYSKKLPSVLFYLLVFTFLLSFCTFYGCKKGGNDKPGSETVTVNFTDYDGTLLLAKTVKKGSVPVYDNSIPEREDENGVRFTFVGWNADGTVYKNLPAVSKNTVFTATYSEAAATYTVTFIVDGEATEKTYSYNEIPFYEGETSFIKNGIYIEITGWNKTFAAVKSDVTYTAIIKKTSSAEIKFIVESESLTLSFPVGSIPRFYGTPYKKADETVSYEFAGWKAKDGTIYSGDLPKVSADGAEYEAVFKEVKKSVKVRFLNETTFLSETSVFYGETPEYSGETPVKAETDEYYYDFIGWSLNGTVYKTLPAVYDDVAFTATYKKTLKSYLLTVIYVKNGEKISKTSEYIFYGDIYDITSPDIIGYSPDKPSVMGYMTENATVTVSYTPVSVWDGSAVSDVYESGSGSKEDPYIIKTAAQLKYMQKQNSGAAKQQYSSGKYFRLEADLDMSAAFWTPIANRGSFTNYSWSYFAGTFDGNGHSIKISAENDKANALGLFEGISGTVKNLTVYGSVSSLSRAGGIAYTLGSGGILENVYNYAKITSSGDYVGGIVGMAANGSVIKNSTNYGTVTSSAAKITGGVGGIVGNAFGITVSGCVNYGGVSSFGRAGGIIGAFFTAAAINISNCINYGIILTKSNGSAGIISYASKGTGKIENCYNYSPVSGTGYTGGIAGLNECLEVSSCKNKGIIKGTVYVGGIVGKITEANLDLCENRGTVYGSGSSIGGIAGAAQVTAKPFTVSKSNNYGSVYNESSSLNSVTGGVTGRTDGRNVDGVLIRATVYECVNYGLVKANKNYVGGVSGAVNGGVTDKSENRGEVYSEGVYVGGIAGSNYGYGAVKNCINYAMVTGGGSVGQICGQLTSTSSSENCSEKGSFRLIG